MTLLSLLNERCPAISWFQIQEEDSIRVTGTLTINEVNIRFVMENTISAQENTEELSEIIIGRVANAIARYIVTWRP